MNGYDEYYEAARHWPAAPPQKPEATAPAPEPPPVPLIVCDQCYTSFDRSTAQHFGNGVYVCPHCRANVNPRARKAYEPVKNYERAKNAAANYSTRTY